MVQQNYLSTKKFEFSIKRLPNVEFYVQGVNLPGLNGSYTPVATPHSNLYRHGDKLEYEDLIVTIRVDENLRAYKELHDWLVSITKPQAYEQYNLKTQRQVNQLTLPEEQIYSDASLFALNSNGNPNLEFRFVDIFPVAISGVQFNTIETDVTFATCDITFKYTYFTIIDEYLN